MVCLTISQKKILRRSSHEKKENTTDRCRMSAAFHNGYSGCIWILEEKQEEQIV